MMNSGRMLLGQPGLSVLRMNTRPLPFPNPILLRLPSIRNTHNTTPLRILYSQTKLQSPSFFHRPPRISLQLQHRTYARRPKPSVTNSFPQFEPRPLKPFYQTRTFWGGLAFFSLLFLTPIPGWILLGGIAYGFFRLFRYLGKIQQTVMGVPGRLSTDGTDFLDRLFAQDPHTRELAAATQELAMSRVEMALRSNEGGIRRIFEEGEELHFTLPRDVSMANFNVGQLTNMRVVLTIKFMVYMGSEGARSRGAEVTASASVEEDGVRLRGVEVLGLGGEGRIKLGGEGVKIEEGDLGRRVDESGVGRGEGEGKTIDATSWSSKSKSK